MALFFFAGLIGAAVGSAELIARYRERPLGAVKTFAALFYIAVNIGASAAACWLIMDVFDVLATGGKPTQADMVNGVLMAGFGAMAFFRTSLFTLRVGNVDVGFGPSLLLDTLLIAADRAVDRNLAAARAVVVERIMQDVNFETAKRSLPTLCFALMQNLNSDEASQISQAVDALASQDDIDEHVKVLNLGLVLLNSLGETVLQTAVTALHSQHNT